jgi:hypothetical protein
MNSLVIKEGKNTPTINFDVDSMIFSIMGRSFPENAKRIYEPVLSWLNNFKPTGKEIIVEFQLFYISSSSIISMLEIIRKFDSLNTTENKVTINWSYDSDDDDLQKTGEDYQKICKLEFNLIAIND